MLACMLHHRVATFPKVSVQVQLLDKVSMLTFQKELCDVIQSILKSQCHSITPYTTSPYRELLRNSCLCDVLACVLQLSVIAVAVCFEVVPKKEQHRTCIPIPKKKKCPRIAACF